MSLDNMSLILERSLSLQLALQNQICAVLSYYSSATCLLCSSTKQSHLTSWLNADCIMITPMDSEVALIFNVFMLPFHHSLPRLLYQSLIPLTFCCYLPDSALDTALECLRMLPFEAGRWSKNGTGLPSLEVGWQRLAGQVCKKAAITVGCWLLYHVVPCCTMLYQVLVVAVVLRSESNPFVGTSMNYEDLFAAATMAQFIQVLYWTFIRQGSHTLLDFHECRRRIPRKRSKMMSLVRRCHCSMESRDASCWQSKKEMKYYDIMKHSSVGSPMQL